MRLRHPWVPARFEFLKILVTQLCSRHEMDMNPAAVCPICAEHGLFAAEVHAASTDPELLLEFRRRQDHGDRGKDAMNLQWYEKQWVIGWHSTGKGWTQMTDLTIEHCHSSESNFDRSFPPEIGLDGNDARKTALEGYEGKGILKKVRRALCPVSEHAVSVCFQGRAAFMQRWHPVAVQINHSVRVKAV